MSCLPSISGGRRPIRSILAGAKDRKVKYVCWSSADTRKHDWDPFQWRCWDKSSITWRLQYDEEARLVASRLAVWFHFRFSPMGPRSFFSCEYPYSHFFIFHVLPFLIGSRTCQTFSSRKPLHSPFILGTRAQSVCFSVFRLYGQLICLLHSFSRRICARLLDTTLFQHRGFTVIAKNWVYCKIPRHDYSLGLNNMHLLNRSSTLPHTSHLLIPSHLASRTSTRRNFVPLYEVSRREREQWLTQSPWSPHTIIRVHKWSLLGSKQEVGVGYT